MASTESVVLIGYVFGILLLISVHKEYRSMVSPSTDSTHILVIDNPGLRALMVSLLICIGVTIAYLATQENIIFSTRVAIILGYVVGVPLLLSANYDRSIIVLFGFASVAGMLKYKTDFNPVIHVTLDIMMGLICLGWFVRRLFSRREGPSTRTPLGGFIALFIFVCVLQIFNPLSYSYLASFAALKMHIFMIPLYFFGYHSLRSIEQIKRWFVAFAVIGLVVGITAIIQFRKGPEQMKQEMPEVASMIDMNTWQDAGGKSFFRPPATTSNAGGGSTWMQCIIPLALAIFMFRRLSKTMRVFLMGAIVVLIAALLISLVRQMLMVTVASLFFVLFLQFRAGRLSRGFGVLCIAGLIGMLGWQVATGVAGSALDELFDLFIHPVEAFSKNRGYTYNIIHLVAQSYPLGAGLGRTGPAAMKFEPDIMAYWETHGGPTLMPGENYFLTMLSETGIPGTMVICLLTLTLVWKGWQSYRMIQHSDLKWAAAASLGVLASIVAVFFGGPALVTAPLNLFFWFLGGALLKMPVLDQALRESDAASVPAPGEARTIPVPVRTAS